MCTIVPMRTSTYTTSLPGMGSVFPLKEAHFYSCLLQVEPLVAHRVGDREYDGGEESGADLTERVAEVLKPFLRNESKCC